MFLVAITGQVLLISDWVEARMLMYLLQCTAQCLIAKNLLVPNSSQVEKP